MKNIFATKHGTDADPPAPMLTIDIVKSSFRKYEDAIQKAHLEIAAIEVACEPTASLMSAKIGALKALVKSIETERKRVIEEPDHFVRQVNSFCKGFKDKIDAACKDGDGKLTGYRYQQELKRREHEALMRKEMEKKQAEMDAAAAKANVAPVVLPTPVIPAKPEPIRTESATVSSRTVWKFEVTDSRAVPREYCVPDERAIREAVASGIRSIEGVRIYETIENKYRTV